MLDIQLCGTFMLTRACLPYRRAANPYVLTLSPPQNMAPHWLGQHPGYTVAKYGMTLLAPGGAEEYREAGVASNTLWSDSLIAAAGAASLLGGAEARPGPAARRSWQTPLPRSAAGRPRRGSVRVEDSVILDGTTLSCGALAAPPRLRRHAGACGWRSRPRSSSGPLRRTGRRSRLWAGRSSTAGPPGSAPTAGCRLSQVTAMACACCAVTPEAPGSPLATLSRAACSPSG